ncbi:metallophosphoesterase family protein [Clostridium paridis]|uniref:Phosphoesterase n=1 Tax=Clostridium paridis TaxID=2803863 RepID=A0A937FD84_9CLOT|nr:metallophosphoesterase family protein [Clostridium paridis]MBL4930655.1 metallophosphoesterase family protein [Clostridium paridis]
MRIAAISDIHGNIYALMSVLEDIDNENIDFIMCLGDLVGYGPHPNEVIALIRRKRIPCLKGNYDASVVDNDFTYIRDTSINSFVLPWTVNELRASNKEFLNNLPSSMTLEFEEKKITFVHGSPRRINEYLLQDSEETAEIMKDFQGDILVAAHTHLPGYKEFNDKLFINDGSVGKPMLGRPNATYAIIDIQGEAKPKVNFKEVPYEYKRIMKDMQLLDFPTRLIDGYESGTE